MAKTSKWNETASDRVKLTEKTGENTNESAGDKIVNYWGSLIELWSWGGTGYWVVKYKDTWLSWWVNKPYIERAPEDRDDNQLC